MTRPAATALALLAAVAAAVFAPAARAVTACPHNPNAQGLSTYYLAKSPSSNIVGGIRGVYLDFPLLSDTPVVLDPNQAVNWTRVQVAAPINPMITSERLVACTCDSFPASCIGPFSYAAGVCNIPPNRPTTGTGSGFNPYQSWGLTMTGSISVPQTGYYTFSTTADDGMTMWVDGALVAHQSIASGQFGSIMYWPPGCTSSSGTRSILLVSGQKYCVLIRHYQNGGSSGLSLYWSASSTQGGAANLIPSQTLIPDSAFSPCAPTGSSRCSALFSSFDTVCNGVNNNQVRVTTYDTNNQALSTTSSTSINSYSTTSLTVGQSVEFTGFIRTATTGTPAVGAGNGAPNSLLLSNIYQFTITSTAGDVALYLDDVLLFSGSGSATQQTFGTTNEAVPLLQTPTNTGYKFQLVYTKVVTGSGSVTLRWQPANLALDSGNFQFISPGLTCANTVNAFPASPGSGYTAAAVPSSAFRSCAAFKFTPTPSATASYTQSATQSATASYTQSATQSATASFTQSATASFTESATASFTESATASFTESATATSTPTVVPCATIIDVHLSTLQRRRADPTARYGDALTITGTDFDASYTITCSFDGGVALGVQTTPATYDSDTQVRCETAYGIYGPATLSIIMTLNGQDIPGCNSLPLNIVGPFGEIVFTGPRVTTQFVATLVSGDESAPKDCLAYSTAEGALAGYTLTDGTDEYCCTRTGIRSNDGSEDGCLSQSCAGNVFTAECLFISPAIGSNCYSSCFTIFRPVAPSPPVTDSELQYLSDSQPLATFASGTNGIAIDQAKNCYINMQSGALTSAFTIIVSPNKFCCAARGWYMAGVCNVGCPFSGSVSVYTDDYIVDFSDTSGYQGNAVCYVNCYGVTEEPRLT